MPDSAPLPLPDWLAALPAVNASLNGLATLLLLVGLGLIKAGRRNAHKVVMLATFGVSVLFLVSYLTYHQGLHHYTGSHGKSFAGTGFLLAAYRVILISHVVLAAVVPVLALITLVRGFRADWPRHRRIARVTFPIWLYVSITGVVIYAMLYHLPVQPPPREDAAASGVSCLGASGGGIWHSRSDLPCVPV